MSALESDRLWFKHPCEPGALGGGCPSWATCGLSDWKGHDGVCQVPGKEGPSRCMTPARGHDWVIPTERTVAGQSFGSLESRH